MSYPNEDDVHAVIGGFLFFVSATIVSIVVIIFGKALGIF